MKVHGGHHFAAPRRAVFDAICDPSTLLAIIPGCEAVERTADGSYEGRITLRLPGVVGSYRTHIRLVDAVPPERSGLHGRLDGAMGSIDGTADFELRDAGEGTDMDYRGSGRIDGPLARLDSRFAERLAESLINQGLRALDNRLTTATEDPE